MPGGLSAWRAERIFRLLVDGGTSLYSVAYLLPTHVAFSGNKQLSYGLPPTEAK